MAQGPAQRLVLFSDLDGSLLDHDTYEWAIATPAIDELKRRGFPLVLVSSKTLPEIDVYRRAMSLEDPVVAENGGLIDVPDGYFEGAAFAAQATVDRESLQRIFEEIRAGGGYDAEGFYELGVDGIAAATGLSAEAAELANRRQASEPLLWRDTEERLAGFASAAARRGLRCVQGGRFVHLMGGFDKGDAVEILLDAYERKWPDATLVSVALGDGPNDLDMLRAADIAVVIPGRHDHDMPLHGHKRVIEAASAGPAGWLAAVNGLLEEHAEPDATGIRGVKDGGQ